jgi:asparagine synthase (glutamine-hydrolysing)
MCGIAGFWGEGDQANLAAMTARLRHRGPDDYALYVSGDAALASGVFLGHTRLAILDIARGKQPFVDAGTKMALVYNGEVYNHQELRAELIRRGHIFVTDHSDTETVLRAFMEWGAECFAMFNGMFALAIHDPARHELWLARDRFGEKPLFCTQNARGFAFGSEMGALSQWSGFDQAQDMDNLQRFLAWGYMPGVRTLYKNCRAIAPGSWLRADLRSGETLERSYYRFELRPDHALTERDEPALVEELRALLVRAVDRRLLSDVPLGVFLSGGLDSGALLAAAVRVRAPEMIDAFTVGFTEPSFDESPKARAVAAALGVRHHVSCLTLEHMRAGALGTLARMSEPLGDASLIPTRALARFTRERVTVALSGDGGDELFAGYDPFLALSPARIYGRFMPGPLHRLLKKAVNRCKSSDRNMSLEFKLKRTLRGLDYAENMRLPVWMGSLSPEEIGAVFEYPLSAEELYEDALSLWEKYGHYDLTEQALMFFTHFYLPGDILVKVDRATMMESLESRAVFLDNDVADFCARLPHMFKLRGHTRKYLLKKALQGWLPEKILRAPKKGFGIPLNRWLRELEWAPPPLPGARRSEVEAMHTRHGRRQGDYRLFLWSCLALRAMPQRAAPA